MSSNWNLVLKAANLSTIAVRMKQARVNGEKYATSTVEPFLWVCANSTCRAEYMREPYASEYCPQCNGYLKAGRGDLLDPVVYAACQKIIADECKADHKTQEYRDWLEDFSGYKAKPAPNPEAAWRALLGLPPLKGDYEDTPEEVAAYFKSLVKVGFSGNGGTSHEYEPGISGSKKRGYKRGRYKK